MKRILSLEVLAAPLFVLLWSTGFIGAKYGLPDADPMAFLALRFALAVPLLWLWHRASRAEWLSWRQAGEAAVIGVLLHGVYLGCVFQAIDWGVSAGLAALITGLQPVTTAFLALVLLEERMGPVQWAGMALGVGGVCLVVWRRLGAGLGDEAGIALCFLALLAITLASILQKRWAGAHPMRASTIVQFAAACVFATLLALVFGQTSVTWTADFVFALGWLVLVLSLGAVTLLLLLLRRGAASNVASLFFLVPASTALIAWAVFGETLGPLQLVGVALTALGVLMVNRPGLFRP